MNFTATINEHGHLVVTADQEARDEAASYRDYDHWGDIDVLTQGFEHYWTNGLFHPFPGNSINPRVGLTDAECIAEGMDTDEDGNNEIVGRLWWYPQYEVESCVTELIEKGTVTFTLAP